MILVKTAQNLTQFLANKSHPGLSIGFVPTMGALHPGHIGLIEQSKKNTGITVCSIFVNPTQFNDRQDFERYPVTLDNDLLLLEKAGCDIVFLPAVNEVYPNGMTLDTPFNLGYLETVLEGKYRPGHFQGVCQVVKRLLEIVQPTILFMGQKDYQQCMVIKKLIALEGFNTELAIVATIREASGLAMSSRNLRLSTEDKVAASVIYRTLQYLKETIQPGILEAPLAEGKRMIYEAGFEKTDYVSIAQADTLEPVSNWNGHDPLVALVAAFISGVRLIDNMKLN
jgi:pantoate--beta-alanine ligase